jgi:rhomboid protease GluP
MDYALITAINVMAVAAVVIISTLRYRPHGYAAWVAINALVISVTAAALWQAPEWAGWIAAALFGTFVVTPVLLAWLATWLAGRQAYRHALWAAFASRAFYPAGEVVFNIRLAEVMAADPATVPDRLRKLQATSSAHQGMRLEAFHATELGDWPRALDTTQVFPADNLDVKSIEIRALGELGRMTEMALVFAQARVRLHGMILDQAHLFLFVFTGRSAGVKHLLKGPFQNLDREAKDYWLAVTAAIGRPNDTELRARLETFATSSPKPKLRRSAQRHLALLAAAPTLSADAHAIADAAEARLISDAALRPQSLRACRVTLGLVALNAAAFAAAEWSGGSEDLDVLMDLGAIWPPYIVTGAEWWRLLTGVFLHYGPLHFAINMLMLMQLGRLVESALGAWRMAAAYIWCAVASSAAVCALMWFEFLRPSILVGASGAIFGLFGIEATRMVGTWLKSRDAIDRSRLAPLALILVIQTVADLSIPNVSFSAHAMGFVAGIAAGVILLTVKPYASARPAQVA